MQDFQSKYLDQWTDPGPSGSLSQAVFWSIVEALHTSGFQQAAQPLLTSLRLRPIPLHIARLLGIPATAEGQESAVVPHLTAAGSVTGEVRLSFWLFRLIARRVARGSGMI